MSDRKFGARSEASGVHGKYVELSRLVTTKMPEIWRQTFVDVYFELHRTLKGRCSRVLLRDICR